MPGRNDDYAMLAEAVLPDEAKRAEVVVIGGVSAGLSSAISAREAGADVLVAGSGVFKAADRAAAIAALKSA